MNTSTARAATVALSKQEQAFFVELGARIAQRRKAQAITQVQLAEWLGVSQQTITAYEVGRRRIQVSALPTIARALGIAVEELIEGDRKVGSKRGPAPKIQQQLERVATLPKARQRVIGQVLDSMLASSR